MELGSVKEPIFDTLT